MKEVIRIVSPFFVLAAWWAAAGNPWLNPWLQPSPVPAPGSPWSRPPDPIGWVKDQLASAWVSVWGWVAARAGLLLALILLAAASLAALYVLRRWWWRRAVQSGTWVEVVPPRVTSLGQSAAAWRLLASLAVRAQGGLHLVKPPLAMEIHGDGGRLALTVWVPSWITTSAVAGEVRLAWPGATTRLFTPPTGGQGWHAAGYHLVPTHTDLGPLVEDTHMGRDAACDADPLRPVFDALRHAGGPAVLQVLAKPAPGRRINLLSWAARHPAKPRRRAGTVAADLAVKALLGLIRLVLDFLTRSGKPTASQPQAYGPPDALQRAQMRRAAEKLAAGPHLLVAIRTLAVRPGRAYARGQARQVAHGYAVAAKLRPRRLWRALRLVTQRYAPKGHWLVATASELGVLFHFPADPARHGFPVAALTRTFPTAAAQIPPERPTAHTCGWSASRWSQPAGLAVIDDDEPDPFHEYDESPFLTPYGDHHDEN